MKYQCSKGHVANDPDYCRACVGEAFKVSAVVDAPAPEPAPPPVEAKPEELTPIIEPLYEGANLPVSKHPAKHGKR